MHAYINSRNPEIVKADANMINEILKRINPEPKKLRKFFLFECIDEGIAEYVTHKIGDLCGDELKRLVIKTGNSMKELDITDIGFAAIMMKEAEEYFARLSSDEKIGVFKRIEMINDLRQFKYIIGPILIKVMCDNADGPIIDDFIENPMEIFIDRFPSLYRE